MRDIKVSQVEEIVAELCVRANIVLPSNLTECIQSAKMSEVSTVGIEVLSDIFDNVVLAKQKNVPICQDTGMAIVFLEVGQDVHFTNGNVYDAVNRGVAKGYTEGFLRCSIVADPFERVNTKDNSPAIIHTVISSGDKVSITVCPKGFGSENMSALKMFNPTSSREEVAKFVTDIVDNAGSNPCPPIIVGVGIGGDFEYCALLAKKAVCRDVAIRHSNAQYAQMEQDILCKINKLGIGPQGFGGKTTALAVNIETYPTHIAGLPVAVNIGCHVTRHAKSVI